MTELTMSPIPPESPPSPSVVVLGRFQPFHRGHAYMIEFANDWRLKNMPKIRGCRARRNNEIFRKNCRKAHRAARTEDSMKSMHETMEGV